MIVFPYWKIDTENQRCLLPSTTSSKDWKDETFSKTVDNYIQSESMPQRLRAYTTINTDPEPYDDMEDGWKAIREKRIAMGLDPIFTKQDNKG